MLVLIRWLVFRVEFGAGLIKMRGDACWRDLTCLTYHHETQPMPGPFSWWFHRLPAPLHKAEVLGNHVAQLVVPFLLFAPQPVAGVAAATIIVTQLWLVISGNFSWLNSVTIALAIPALGDGILRHVVPVDPPGDLGDAPAWHDALVVGLAVARRVAQRPAGAQPGVPAPADELELRPAAPRQHVRRVRQRHEDPSRGHRRGHERRRAVARPANGASTGSRASRATRCGGRVSSRRTTCASTG